MHAIEMSQARLDHTAAVIELVTEISAWLAARGIQQWPYPPGPEVRQLFTREIARGEVYLAWQIAGRDPLGLLRFEWHDAQLWPGDPDGGGYVHSLGVRPSAHGRGVGAGMLHWAAEHVRARGRRYLRLDCVAGNRILGDYYQGLGFRLQGVASHAGYSGALFELDLDQVPGMDAGPRSSGDSAGAPNHSISIT
jgi:GNAT superfamily N-acetyltransferase